MNAVIVTYCNFCNVESGSPFRLSRLLSHSQNLNWQRTYSALEFMNTVNTWSSLGLMSVSPLFGYIFPWFCVSLLFLGIPWVLCVCLLRVRAEPLEVISRTVKQGQLNMGDNSQKQTISLLLHLFKGCSSFVLNFRGDHFGFFFITKHNPNISWDFHYF